MTVAFSECTPHAPREVVATRPHAEREEYDIYRFAGPSRGWSIAEPPDSKSGVQCRVAASQSPGTRARFAAPRLLVVFAGDRGFRCAPPPAIQVTPLRGNLSARPAFGWLDVNRRAGRGFECHLSANATVKESLTVQISHILIIAVHEGRLRPFPAAGGIRPDVYVGFCDAPRSLPIFAVPAAARGGGWHGENRKFVTRVRWRPVLKHRPNTACGGKARERASFQPFFSWFAPQEMCVTTRTLPQPTLFSPLRERNGSILCAVPNDTNRHGWRNFVSFLPAHGIGYTDSFESH